jgi:RHS repeat-associated protein
MIYDNGQLRQIQLDQGYITFSGTSPQYHFYLKDHLGNNRMVVNASGTVEQVNHYYAFGGLMGESTGGDVQDFKYNGKELDRLHGLDWYDYSARHMDAARGVFTTMDPLAEKYYDISPYAYCANNPINSIDINGDSITVDKYGENLERKGNDNNVYMSENGKDVYIGEIGKSININDIAKNVFARNAKIAKELKNPISFYKKVKTNGDWDLKNKENTIWQFAKTHNINFQYGNEMLKAEDVGNFNFGIVAKAYGIPENIALKGAGLYQIYSGTSSVEWQKVGLLINSTLTPSGIISTSMDYNLLAPYGDDPIDQYWIKRGYNY